MRDFPMTGHRLLTADEERALAERIRGDDPEDAAAAVNELVGHNLRLAATFTGRRRRCRGLDAEDVYQECVMGLYEAARHFDPDKGRYTTIAWYWMKQRVVLAESGRFTVYVPKWAYERVAWSDEKLAGLFEGARVNIATARRAIFAPAYRLGNCPDHVTDAVESLAAPAADADDRLDARDLWAAVDRLPPRHAEVLRRRTLERQTLRQVGEVMGITKERVRQIEGEAIRRLRELAGVETGGGA